MQRLLHRQLAASFSLPLGIPSHFLAFTQQTVPKNLQTVLVKTGPGLKMPSKVVPKIVPKNLQTVLVKTGPELKMPSKVVPKIVPKNLQTVLVKTGPLKMPSKVVPKIVPKNLQTVLVKTGPRLKMPSSAQNSAATTVSSRLGERLA